MKGNAAISTNMSGIISWRNDGDNYYNEFENLIVSEFAVASLRINETLRNNFGIKKKI